MRRFIGVAAIALLTSSTVIRCLAEDGALPKDVFPESRNRLPLLKRENVTDRARRTYDTAVANFAGAEARGAAIRLHASPVTNLQMESPVGLPLLQLAILATGREHDQPFEWSLHEMQALAVGLDPAVIDVVRRNQPLTKLGDKEAVIIQVGRELFRTHKLGSGTYARALSVLGQTGLVDVVALMADYSRTCAILTAFNQQMPPGFKQFLPLPFTPPDDVYPDSKSRLPLLPSIAPNPATVLYTRPMTPEGTGPGHLRRHGAGIKALLANVQHRDIDLAVLVSAREHDSQYDWTINELAALKDGLEPDVIDVIRNRKPSGSLEEKDASLVEFGRELFAKHTVNSETYRRVVKVFGEQNLVDVVEVMGQHAAEATLLAAFDQHLPPGQPPLCCPSANRQQIRSGTAH